LPPLLFEAALNLHWRELSTDFPPILALSTLGVLISAAVVTVGMTFLLDWPLGPALIFGVAIAATDPIAVIALFKDNGIKGRLRTLVESESLFNDGTAAVLFALAYTSIRSGAMGVASITYTLTTMIGGGIAVGLLCGAVSIMLIGRTSDYLVETTVTTVAAYGSFLAAEHFGFSGVLATVVTGILMGNWGPLKKSERGVLIENGRAFLLSFWDFAAFIANSLVFLLIGLAVATVSFKDFGIAPLSATICLVLVARGITVYPICFIFRNSRWNIPIPEQHVLWWGGLRGALALALTLALPPEFDHRNEIIVAAFAVVVFSVVVQGLTMPALLKILGISNTSTDS